MDMTVELGRPPRTYTIGTQKVLRCAIRDHPVAAKPEEIVRQRIIHWLLSRGFNRTQIKVESHLAFTDRSRGRPDICIDSNDRLMVIECKQPGIPPGEDAVAQAKRYAVKLRAAEAWITNGQDNVFLARTRAGSYEGSPSSRMLKVRANPQPIPIAPPETLSRRKARDYVSLFPYLRHVATPVLHQFVVSAHALMFSPPGFFKLPKSESGFHILEDRGLSRLSFSTPGGRWNSWYRILLIATEGEVDAAAIGLNAYPRHPDGLILCVGFLKRNRKHHALQLRVAEHCWSNRNGDFIVTHDGRMGGRGLPRAMVLEAVEEAGRDDLFSSDAHHPLGLGILPAPQRLCRANAVAFLNRLLHYALVRTQLRECHPYVRK